MKAASIHSRAAKRASSPSIDLDKSLKSVKPPGDAKDIRPSVLAIHQGAGISKKSKNGRKSVLSAKAARRKEKGMDRAEAFMDKKDKKVEKSKGRARNVQDRSKAWEVQNKTLLELYTEEVNAVVERGGCLSLPDDEMEETLPGDIEAKGEGISGEVSRADEMVDAAPIPLPDSDDEEL
jgi:hypothetical protein